MKNKKIKIIFGIVLIFLFLLIEWKLQSMNLAEMKNII